MYNLPRKVANVINRLKKIVVVVVDRGGILLLSPAAGVLWTRALELRMRRVQDGSHTDFQPDLPERGNEQFHTPSVVGAWNDEEAAGGGSASQELGHYSGDGRGILRATDDI
jgi:hypothetical protein